MRKLTKCIAIMLVATMALVGCSKKETKEASQFDAPKSGDTVAEIVVKDFGSIKVRFFADKAPKAVENFVTHAKEGYYDGLTFHRIINDFMIQGGDPEGTGMGGESIWGENFEDEFSDDLHPLRGALCMANSGSNTNGSQFFIVQANPLDQATVEGALTANGYELGESYLDSFKTFMKAAYNCEFSDDITELYMEKGGTPWLFEAHTVFGQIYDDASYDVLDAIASVDMEDANSGIPANDVIIETIKISEYK
ncbi:peptidylprolyl isomerase [Anaerosporobacter sp.]